LLEMWNYKKCFNRS